MNIGTLDKRVSIKAQGPTQDALGQPVQSWQVVATVWGNVRYASGVESIKADAVTSIAKASIRIRHRVGLTSAMRAEVGGAVFEIKAVLPASRQGYLDLVCESIT